jgi:hypothetical protein
VRSSSSNLAGSLFLFLSARETAMAWFHSQALVHFCLMKSAVICGSKRYRREIAEFAEQLEKLGVLVFEPNFKEPLPENVQPPSSTLKPLFLKD